MTHKSLCAMLAPVALVFISSLALADGDTDFPVIPHLSPSPNFSDPTPPANGDVNPYGVAFVPKGFPSGGPLHPGDVLVSNFNNSGNLQGTGTTIARVNSSQNPTLFFTADSNPGLSTALGVLKSGYVIVGNVPSTPTSPGTPLGTCNVLNEDAGPGALLVIDKQGNLVEKITSESLLAGPWDLTIKDEGQHAEVFVSNVLTGTVTRINLEITGDGDGDKDEHVVVKSKTQIASGYAHRCDPGAFVVGPTGLALDRERDVLYVASTGDNAIFAIRDASDRTSDASLGELFIQDDSHLHGPLGLAIAPNGDLITSQGDVVNPDPNQVSEIVEYSSKGKFVAEFSIDPAAGAAFGLAIVPFEDGFRFAAVDDGLNVLDLGL